MVWLHGNRILICSIRMLGSWCLASNRFGEPGSRFGFRRRLEVLPYLRFVDPLLYRRHRTQQDLKIFRDIHYVEIWVALAWRNHGVGNEGRCWLTEVPRKPVQLPGVCRFCQDVSEPQEWRHSWSIYETRTCCFFLDCSTLIVVEVMYVSALLRFFFYTRIRRNYRMI